MEFFIYYLVIINLVGLLVIRIDKKKARKGSWRIPEKQIWLTALLGGSLGVFLGMEIYRHKTKHKSFIYGVPIIIILQISVAFFLYL
jgi:uncharacterized membrane protein YsdA (DUF1294 family)